MRDLYDSAEKQRVLGDALQGRHEEGAQVHATQCRVVILRDVQKDSEKTKNNMFNMLHIMGKLKKLILGSSRTA